MSNFIITKCSFCLCAHLDHDGNYHCHKQYCVLTNKQLEYMMQKIFDNNNNQVSHSE